MNVIAMSVQLTVSQVRLRVGPFVLVAVSADSDIQSLMWAVPGGGVRTYHQLARLARYYEWGKPRPIRAVVRYRSPDATLVSPS